MYVYIYYYIYYKELYIYIYYKVNIVKYVLYNYNIYHCLSLKWLCIYYILKNQAKKH
jgi:hypothetical protein